MNQPVGNSCVCIYIHKKFYHENYVIQEKFNYKPSLMAIYYYLLNQIVYMLFKIQYCRI